MSTHGTATHALAIAMHPATASPLSDAISLLGLLAVAAYVGWRFGPTLARTTGWCSWWVAWACGSQGGYGYFAAFAVFGALAWSAGTIWYARRRGYWPSAISAKILPRVLDLFHRVVAERRRSRATRQPSGLSANRPLRPL